jgi:hypothetical protein
LRIEVLHGSGYTLYGEDAVGGAVNFVTAAPSRTEVRARIGFGNCDFNQQRLTVSYLADKWSEVFVAATMLPPALNRTATIGAKHAQSYWSLEGVELGLKSRAIQKVVRKTGRGVPSCAGFALSVPRFFVSN